MSERFKVIDDDFSKWIVDTTLKEDKHEGAIYTAYDMCHKLNELCEENEVLLEEWSERQQYFKKVEDEYHERVMEQQATIERLRTQLLICQQSKNDNGRIKVWQVPPIQKGMRITTSTTLNGEKYE